MRVASLGSGSAGNATLIETDSTRVLVDVGFSATQLERRLSQLGIDPASITGAVVTHEHQDHSRGAGVSARRWGWPLYMTAGTLGACSALFSGSERVEAIDADREFSIGDLQVQPLRTSHDAAEPIAVTLEQTETGLRAGIVTDLGRPSSLVRNALATCQFLLIEANHDELMLRESPYPWSVKQRIGGSRGHLSNRLAGELAAEMVYPHLGTILLAHLSAECNRRDLARAEVERQLARTCFAGRLHVTQQDRPTALFEVAAWPGGSGRAGQLNLFTAESAWAG